MRLLAKASVLEKSQLISVVITIPPHLKRIVSLNALVIRRVQSQLQPVLGWKYSLVERTFQLVALFVAHFSSLPARTGVASHSSDHFVK